MKKILVTVLSLVIVFTVLPLTALSVSAFETSGYYTYYVSCDEAEIMKCDKSISGNIEIPSQLGGYPVTSIFNGAFSNCNLLTGVTIPDSVTSISGCVFDGCTSLKTIVLPDSLTSIEYTAFYNTAYFNDNSNWDNKVLYVGNYLVFVDKKISGDYSVKPGTRLIANGAFDSCKSLKSITIANSVLFIGNNTFSNCQSLESVTLGNNVKSIGAGAFDDCDKIKKLYIPKSVESIGYYAFDRMYSLTDLYYGGSEKSWYEAYPAFEADMNNSVPVHFNAKICDAYGHKLVTKNKKAATYFEKGYTGDKVCSVCGEVSKKGKAIAKLKLKTPKITLTAGKNLFKVKYTKVTGATGFQLRYKLNGNWTTKNFDTKKTVTKTIKKLKKGKKYTVQIRAYVKSGKNTAYSSWTKTKNVKVK